jgi:predicted ArsR family transcriptional regulator
VRSTAAATSLVGFGDHDAAARAYDAFGILPLRIEIVRFALSRPEFSAADVMAEFGLTRNGALQHLRKLTDEGLLFERRCTHPRGSGPITYWRADADGVHDLLAALVDHVMSSAYRR